MIPSAFVLMEKFPLTSNGKIDRKALPAFSYENIQPAQDFVRPHTETEKALAAIWTALLKVESIGINDSFFDLGGNSLMAIKAVSRIRDVFGVDLKIHTLFENPTLVGLSNVLTEAKVSSENTRWIEGTLEGHPAVRQGVGAVTEVAAGDKRADNVRPELESGYLSERTEIEHTIAAIWQEVLHVEKIGVNDDFFESGGSLLSSANMIAKVNHAFKVKLPLSVVFQERTVSKLAFVVERSKARNGELNSKKERGDQNDVMKLVG
jgi:acyl carrier protein